MNTFRYKIRLDTQREVMEFINIISELPYDIYVTDGYSRVSPKSVIFALAVFQWKNLSVESNADIYTKIEKFIPSSLIDD